MARTDDLGARTDGRRVSTTPRSSDPLPPGLSREAEAELIAERLAALVASRRANAATEPVAPVLEQTVERVVSRSAPSTEGRTVVGARHSGRLLGNLLLTRGYLVESELRFALARQATTGGPIGQILVELGLITDRDLVELLAEQLRMQVIDLSRAKCDPAVFIRLPKHTARRLAALPMRLVDGHIDVAIADPSDDEGIDELMALLGAPLRLFLATRADIDAAVDRLYG